MLMTSFSVIHMHIGTQKLAKDGLTIVLIKKYYPSPRCYSSSCVVFFMVICILCPPKNRYSVVPGHIWHYLNFNIVPWIRFAREIQ